MDDQYKDCISKDGKLYRYDYDYDCWYRVITPDEYSQLPHWDKFGWIWVTIALTVVAAIVTYS